MYRSSTKVSSELGSVIVNYIVEQRAVYKEDAIDEAMHCLREHFSYSLTKDFVDADCRYDRGVIHGYYNLAYYLEILSDDEYEKLCHQLYAVFDPDMIIESAVNKMKGKEENGNKA